MQTQTETASLYLIEVAAFQQRPVPDQMVTRPFVNPHMRLINPLSSFSPLGGSARIWAALGWSTGKYQLHMNPDILLAGEIRSRA